MRQKWKLRKICGTKICNRRWILVLFWLKNCSVLGESCENHIKTQIKMKSVHMRFNLWMLINISSILLIKYATIYIRTILLYIIEYISSIFCTLESKLVVCFFAYFKYWHKPPGVHETLTREINTNHLHFSQRSNNKHIIFFYIDVRCTFQ